MYCCNTNLQSLIYKILLIFIFFTFNIFAQATKNFSITPLPVIYYSPETRLGLGAAAAMVFRLPDSDSARTTKSNIQPFFIYTLNKQLMSNIPYTIFGNQNKWRTEGELAYFYFPEFYFGLGNNTPESTKQLVSFKWLRFLNKTGFKINNLGYWGWIAEAVSQWDVRPQGMGIFQQNPPLGSQGSFITGTGPLWMWDSRDYVMDAHKGWFGDVSLTYFNKGLGGRAEFWRFRTDFRYYYNLSKKKPHILAFQAITQFTFGDAPYRHQPPLGGDQMLRGYYWGRYRANHYVALQTELRFPIYKRFRGAIFAAAGQVSPSLSQFMISQIRWTAGVGLRFVIHRADRVNIRADQGFGNNTDGFYLNLGEAF